MLFLFDFLFLLYFTCHSNGNKSIVFFVKFRRQVNDGLYFNQPDINTCCRKKYAISSSEQVWVYETNDVFLLNFVQDNFLGQTDNFFKRTTKQIVGNAILKYEIFF